MPCFNIKRALPYIGMDLEQLIENCGIAKSPPPSPKKGIPKRFFPGFLRLPIQLIILPFIWVDMLSQKIAKLFIPPPFIKAGKCKKRGNCCHYVLVRKIRGPFGFLDLFWHTQINGFYRREKKAIPYEKGDVYVMGCRHLRKDGSCGNYFLRPSVCRTWPRIEIFGVPEILKGCGFYAENRTKHPLNIVKD